MGEGLSPAPAHPGLRGEVEHPVRGRDEVIEGGVSEVELDELELLVLRHEVEIRRLQRPVVVVGERVDAVDRVAALEERLREV